MKMKPAILLQAVTLLINTAVAKGDAYGLPIKAVVMDGKIGGHSDLEPFIPEHGNYDLTNNPQSTEPSLHATGVAGILVGVPFGKLFNSSEVQVLSVALPDGPQQLAEKVIVDDSSLDALAKGIDWAEEQGARIAVMSIGYDQAANITKEMEVIDKMANSPMLFILAIGNEGKNKTGHAMFEIENGIVVAAVDADAKLLPYSNYGSFPHVGAPGYRIKTIVPGNKIERLSGTSFATPIVAHQILEELLKDPSLSNAEIKDKVKHLKFITDFNPKSPEISNAQESNVKTKKRENIKKQPDATKEESIPDSTRTINEEPEIKVTRVVLAVGATFFIGVAVTYMRGQQAKTRLVNLTNDFKRELPLIEHYGGADKYRVRSKNNSTPYTGKLGITLGGDGYLEVQGGKATKSKKKKKIVLDEIPIDLLNKAKENGNAEIGDSFRVSYPNGAPKVVHDMAKSKHASRSGFTRN